jgi:hypothetical protein
MFAVPATSPWWSTVLRREIPGAAEEDDDGTAIATTGDTPEPAVVPGATLRVTLHTRVPDTPGLAVVEREVPYVRGVVPQIVAAVSELGVASPNVPALLPEGTRVFDVVYTPGGTVYVDFSSEIEAARTLGAEEERALVGAIVVTIIENFAAVRQVVILVDGKTPRPVHLDLSRPLRRDDPIFAAPDALEAAPSPSPPSVPAVSPAAAPAALKRPGSPAAG